MKRRHFYFANTDKSGPYQVKLKLYNGDIEICHNVYPNHYGLSRMLDKCEIKSFEISWEPEKSGK